MDKASKTATKLRRPWMGILVSPPSDPDEDGLEIVHLHPGYPAERAGLMLGDRIVKVQDEEYLFDFGFDRTIQRLAGKRPLEVSFIRNGESRSAKVDLVEMLDGKQLNQRPPNYYLEQFDRAKLTIEDEPYFGDITPWSAEEFPRRGGFDLKGPHWPNKTFSFRVCVPVATSNAVEKYITLARTVVSQLGQMDLDVREIPDETGDLADLYLEEIAVGPNGAYLSHQSHAVNQQCYTRFIRDSSGKWEMVAF